MDAAIKKTVEANKNVFLPLYAALQAKDPRKVKKEDLPELVDYQYLMTKVLFYSKLYGKASLKNPTNKAQAQFYNVDDVPLNFDFSMPYDEAAEYFDNLGIIDAEAFYNDLDTYAGSAFTISNINNANTLLGIQAFITDQLGTGKVDPTLLKETIQDFAVRNGDDPLTPNHLNTVVTTNLQTAFAAGRYEQMQDNPNPYWQYFNSDPQTDICIELSDQVFKKDDPIWDSYYPPNHFNCHSTIVSLDERTLKEEGLRVNKDGNAKLDSLRKANPDKVIESAAGFSNKPNQSLGVWMNKKGKELDVEVTKEATPIFKTAAERKAYEKANG